MWLNFREVGGNIKINIIDIARAKTMTPVAQPYKLNNLSLP